MSGAGGVRWTRWRRLSQALVALAYLLLPLLGEVRLTGTLGALRVGPVDLVEPAGALSAMLAAGAAPLALVLGALPVLALAVGLGPVYCSWACPFGLASEGLDRLRFSGGARWPARAGKAARRPRLAALALLLAGSAALGTPLAAVLSPPRLATALPLEAYAGRVVPWVTGALLLAFLAVELVGPRRAVCRVLCPAGTVAALLRRPFTWGPRFDPGACRCPSYPPCQQACPWGLDPRDLALRDGCTSCMACVERCPSCALVAPGRR